MKASHVIIAVASAVLLAGCPAHRQGTRLIYVPAPPTATAQGSAAQGGGLEIPAPPPVVQTEQPKKHEETVESAPLPRPAHRHRPAHDRTAETEPNSATSPAAAEAPPTGPPELAPARSRAQQAELERHIGDLKGAIRERISALSRQRLSSADLKALEDARNFLAQADQASQQGDMQQSLNLAQKADLLVSAIEKRY